MYRNIAAYSTALVTASETQRDCNFRRTSRVTPSVEMQVRECVCVCVLVGGVCVCGMRS